MSDQIRIRGVFFQADGITAQAVGELLGHLFGTTGPEAAGTLGHGQAVVVPALPAAEAPPPDPAPTPRRRARVVRRRPAAPIRTPKPRPSAEAAEDQVLQAIRKGAKRRAAVAKATGLPMYTVARAVAKLASARRITVSGVGRATCYAVRDGAPPKEED